jgi:peptidoglycan/LPS O-acetylase OafA/YrhL
MGILRTLLAFIVAFSHSAETHFKLMGNDAGLAVLAFYVISGFYMALITEKYQLNQLSYRNIKNFYVSRFLRIFPVFLACTIITIIFGFFHLYKPIHKISIALTQLNLWRDKLFYIIENIFIFGQGFGRFITFDIYASHFVWDPLQKLSQSTAEFGSSFAILGQAWSLSIELDFYLLVPFILTRNIRFISIICFISFFIRYFLHLNGYINYNIEHAFFPAVIGVFLLGSLSQRVIYERIKHGFIFLKPIAIFLSLFILYFMGFEYDQIQSVYYREWSFILLVTLSVPFLFAYFRNSQLDSWIGELSFPIYMTHFLFAGIAKKYNVLYPGIITGIGSFLAALLLIYFLIKPIDNFRYRLLEKRSNFQKLSLKLKPAI